jgi:predicted TIM-barrel fold metal-dependent hydrolase
VTGVPGGFFDAHLHIVDPRFPLETNQGYRPDPFTVADYRDRTKHLGVVGGAVVSGSFQGYDTSYLTKALDALGPSYVGVVQLPADVTEEEVARLDAAGVRAARFNVRRGGADVLAHLTEVAALVHAVAGWHVELYIDSGDLPELGPTLRRLPAVVVDHLGLSAAGFDTLLRLAAEGLHVKATGFGRLDLDVPAALRALHAANPSSLVVGTDLPSTRAPRPFRDADLGLVADTLGADAAAAVFLDNAVRLYRPDAVGTPTRSRPAFDEGPG